MQKIIKISFGLLTRPIKTFPCQSNHLQPFLDFILWLTTHLINKYTVYIYNFLNSENCVLNPPLHYTLRPSFNFVYFHTADMVRKRAVDLISHAYSSISIEDLAALVGLSSEEAALACQQQGWKVDTKTNMVSPIVPEPPPSQATSSEDQLYKLTEFVSFLEN